MQPSVELRWFTDGPLPEGVVNWYEEAVGLADWHERTDRYVRPAAPEGLNVKWREGDIEIKRLVETLGERTWGDATGLVQRWRKWSFPLADELPLAASGKDWLQVTKHRSVRTFGVRDGHLVLNKPGEQAPHGCRVEIAAVERHHREWWTVCLEAFGPDAEAREMLRGTGERIFAEEGTPALTREASMSYVGWLWNQR